MRVALATTRGTAVDEHFGRAGAFVIYDITEDGYTFVELRRVAEGDLDVAVVETRGMGRAHDAAVDDKIGKLDDCRIVYFTEIGGPSAAKLVRAGMMPLKVEEGTGVVPTLEQLLQTVRTNPAPWIRKALAADQPTPDR